MEWKREQRVETSALSWRRVCVLWSSGSSSSRRWRRRRRWILLQGFPSLLSSGTAPHSSTERSGSGVGPGALRPSGSVSLIFVLFCYYYIIFFKVFFYATGSIHDAHWQVPAPQLETPAPSSAPVPGIVGSIRPASAAPWPDGGC